MFFFFRKPLLLGAGKFAANKFKRGGDMKRNLKVQVTKGVITSGDVVIKTIDANDENVKKLFTLPITI